MRISAVVRRWFGAAVLCVGVLVPIYVLAAEGAADGDTPPGYGYGYGMGPGMMGGYGMGPGGYGMMDGMMGGGMGPGMTRGYGMMGGGMGPFGMLDLTDDQRGKINKIHDDLRKQHWALMGKMMDEQSTLRDLYDADEPDAKKIGAVYAAIGKLRQQMAETHVEAMNKSYALLTKEQREQLRKWRRGGWGPAGMHPPGAPPRGMMGR